MQYNDPITKIYIYSFSTDKQIEFESFITDFSDTYTANWAGQDVYGRMDPIYTYKNTVRKITLAFDVPSFSLQEAEYHFNNAQTFIQSMYPVYSEEINGVGVATMQTPPLFKLQMGNNLIKNPSSYTSTNSTRNNNQAFVNGLLGYIDNFSFKPDIGSGFLSGSNSNLYAKLFKVNFTFFVIHEYPLGNTISNNQHITRLQLSKNQQAEKASSEGQSASNISAAINQNNTNSLLS